MSENTRREFLGTAAAAGSAGLVASLAARRVGAAPVDASAEAPAGARTAMAPSPSGSKAQGALAAQIALTAERLTKSGVPAYTDAMVLADVTLDKRRRFFNFSGDISGRYLEALSVLPAPGRAGRSLPELAQAILAEQRPDGRFGRADLAFTAAETGNEHMALLWGNGRLLVGLMAYHQTSKDPAILAAARRLADFLLAVREAARAPEVMKRVEGQGAFGFICFTQLTEGLVMLGKATGEQRYFEAARQIVPLLPPRGVQHSHGYLSTLRGALMLHEATGDAAILKHVESLYADLIASSDYIVDGSVLEYFGWGDPANAPALEAAKAASGSFPRNEGCGLADLIRLALDLFRTTGKAAYLEQAERCIVNAFDHNQFATGDFGSKVWFPDGFTPTPSVDRAWWCCTMHGYRAFADILERAVVAEGTGARIDLFVDLDARPGRLELRRRPTGLSVRVGEGLAGPLRLRVPSWVSAMEVRLNGRPVTARAEGGYLEVARGLAAGDQVDAAFTYRTRLILPGGQEQAAASLPADRPTRAALYCGPFLMGVDEALDPMFFSEPWPANLIHLTPDAAAAPDAQGRLRLPVRYEHEGFAGVLETVLRPMGEKPADDQRTLAVWLNFRHA